jgi:hypothetical protein
MSGPIPNLQFQPYNPMDTLIQTALGVYGAGVQGQKTKADTAIQQYILKNPYLLGGEQSKDIGTLIAMSGGNPNNLGQMMTGAGSPYPMPSRNEPQSQQAQPYNNQQPMPNQNMGMQQPPQQQNIGGVPFNMDKLLQDKVKYALSDPAQQQALVAEKSAAATLPYQAFLAKIQNDVTTGGAKDVKQFDTANDILKNSSKISNSSRLAESSINKFEKAMNNISPLLNAPIIGGMASDELKASASPAYREAMQAAQSLVLDWAPVLTANNVLQSDTLKMVQDSKLNPNAPREVNKALIEALRSGSKRMQEQSPFMQYAIKDLKLDPQTAENLWLEYNTALPVDPFIEGASTDNLGKFKAFLNASQGIKVEKEDVMPKKLGDKEMNQKLSGALSVDPELLAEMKRRGLVK